MKIGYFFYGFMADIRMRNGLPYSSPDGSLVHAFTIMHALQEKGHIVYQLCTDRDELYVQFAKEKAFQFFSSEKRWLSYSRSIKTHHSIDKYKKEIICDWPDVDVVILELRMKTRRNILPIDHLDFDEDWILQERLIEHYTKKNIPIIAIDLDYQETAPSDDNFTYVFDLGLKRGVSHHIHPPFYMQDILQFEMQEPVYKITYIGNRYERDEEFQKYLGIGSRDVVYEVYGNWLEGDKDSKERWPHIHFRHRAQPYEMKIGYQHALATPLIMRDVYKQYGLMTNRIIETLLFGTIPLLPLDFTSPFEYVPDFLKIKDEIDMLQTIYDYLMDVKERKEVRKQIVEMIEFCDVKYFVKKLEEIIV